jgi:hypothetical protein
MSDDPTHVWPLPGPDEPEPDEATYREWADALLSKGDPMDHTTRQRTIDGLTTREVQDILQALANDATGTIEHRIERVRLAERIANRQGFAYTATAMRTTLRSLGG